MSEFGLNPHIVGQIKSVLQKYPVIQTAGIFGSRARGDYKNYSDIDIAIHAPDMDTLEYMDIKAELRELPIIFEFNVVHIDQCSNADLVSNVRRDEKVIYRK